MEEYVLSLSYGKDSLACLEAIKTLGLPLDRIIHVDVWATDDIPADFPEMVEFKKKADAIIKERYGIEVEHIYDTRDGEKFTYEKNFYSVRFNRKLNAEKIYGFPLIKGPWCNKLKLLPIKRLFSKRKLKKEGKTIIQYLGIAADETERISRHTKPGYILPLVELGWDEAYCRKWCEDNDLLSPIYNSSQRGGCWFCHNQSVEQLRLLRQNYPHLWSLLLSWDNDSPVPFKLDGWSVHDFDLRFLMEEYNLVPTDLKFRWKMIKDEERLKQLEDLMNNQNIKSESIIEEPTT